RGIYNAVRGFWNSIHIDIPSVDTPFGEIGGGSIDPPNLPPFPLGSGGIVRARPGGTVARLAERGQDEAVIPLPKGMQQFGVGAQAVVVNFNGLVTDPAAAGREVDRVLRKFRGTRS